jgi:hypothetical protein
MNLILIKKLLTSHIPKSHKSICMSAHNRLLIVYFFKNLIIIFSLFNEIFELIIEDSVTDGDIIKISEFLCADIHS